MTNALCSLSRGKKQSTRRRKSIIRGIELGENSPVGKRASCGRRALVQAQAHFGREALAAKPKTFTPVVAAAAKWLDERSS